SYNSRHAIAQPCHVRNYFFKLARPGLKRLACAGSSVSAALILLDELVLLLLKVDNFLRFAERHRADANLLPQFRCDLPTRLRLKQRGCLVYLSCVILNCSAAWAWVKAQFCALLRCPPCFAVAKPAAIIARWLGLRCRRWRFILRTKPTGSSPS